MWMFLHSKELRIEKILEEIKIPAGKNSTDQNQNTTYAGLAGNWKLVSLAYSRKVRKAVKLTCYTLLV